MITTLLLILNLWVQTVDYKADLVHRSQEFVFLYCNAQLTLGAIEISGDTLIFNVKRRVVKSNSAKLVINDSVYRVKNLDFNLNSLEYTASEVMKCLN